MQKCRLHKLKNSHYWAFSWHHVFYSTPDFIRRKHCAEPQQNGIFSKFTTFSQEFELTKRILSFKRYETLSLHLRHSAMVRRWFSENALLSVPGRLAEYILVAPTPELRSMFVKMIVFLCHFAMTDEPIQNVQPTADSLCEQILLHILYLLKTDVPDNGKHLTQYFTMFTMYAGMNVQQKQQLLKVTTSNICVPKIGFLNLFLISLIYS